ncbi:MAG: alpha/beta hydrolase family protein, partial [Parahaliea sp.]
PADGSCELVTFASPFKTLHPAMRDVYPREPRNMRARAQHWRHDDGPRPTICVIHGFLADPYWFNKLFFALPRFYAQGYDILLYTLPYHDRKQGPLSPFSGHGIFAKGICNFNESMIHAVHDFRIFLDYLESGGVDRIGVTGISLGGYTTALLAAVEERLAFAIPNVPLVSPADLMLEWFPSNIGFKTLMKISDTPVSDARHMVAVHSPLTYQPVLPKERLMIIAGAGDRLAPPKHARLLWEHWCRPDIHWFPGNHVLHLDRGSYLRKIGEFLKAIDFVV